MKIIDIIAQNAISSNNHRYIEVWAEKTSVKLV